MQNQVTFLYALYHFTQQIFCATEASLW